MNTLYGSSRFCGHRRVGCLLALAIVSATLATASARERVSVQTVDFLSLPGVSINAAGPVLVKLDTDRGRLVVAHTLSSAVSFITCRDGSVVNVPVGGRAFQHLKSEALAIRPSTGEAYLIGAGALFIASPEAKKQITVPTEVQFEAVAVDDETGNAFLAGRESRQLGFYDAKAGKLRAIDWLETAEPLVNLNATPPPPIRKVVCDPKLRMAIAIDGVASTLHRFDSRTGKPIDSRALPLTSGGRWHLAGYDAATRTLYLVVETADRKVIEAARIDVAGRDDAVVGLPGLTEGVGMAYHPVRKEVYVAYDNHPTVHAIGFEDGGSIAEIMIPSYGNDGSALDVAGDLLYVSSWAFGEVDVVDLETRTLRERIKDLGIIPHMFASAFDPAGKRLYFPKGGTAVNGAFGASLTALDPATGKTEKVITGWAPVDLVEIPDRDGFLVFNSEDQFAEVKPDGSFEVHTLPDDHPIAAAAAASGGYIYLSYGAHQSYWPVVYIWGAKDGILRIDPKTFELYDRRIPRQALQLVTDDNGALYFTQNNWGAEEPFVGVLADPVREFDVANRIRLGGQVQRETTQRVLRYDAGMNRLYVVRVGENDDVPGVLHIVDLATKTVLDTVPVGLSPTDLAFDAEHIFVANFDSRNVSVIDKRDPKTAFERPTREQPLRLCAAGDAVYVLTHSGKSLERLNPPARAYDVPLDGIPDNVFAWGDRLVVTSHNARELFVMAFDPRRGAFDLLHRERYAYGDTRFDTRNASFYMRGQFGDAVLTLTKGRTDRAGRLWITDFLSGKLFILSTKAGD